jgi:membrane fusion protein (multidrug efflux system)
MAKLPDRMASRLTSPWPCVAALTCALAVAACGKEEKAAAPAAPIAVTALTVAARDVPISAEYVAQTQSSQAVNIQARVSGFLDKRVYVEGSVVKAGQVLFQMDQKPFQAQVDAQKAALARNQAAMDVAQANLARTKPLAAQNALSQKDLDDATGQFEQASAAVQQSKAQLQEAQLNLSYTTITSPVTGVSSYAAVADGTYLSPTNSQLTTISVLSPMWINFSVSENKLSQIRDDVRNGQLKLPATGELIVEIELVDGTTFPSTGRITFTDPSFNPQTGTFLIRASVNNAQGILRPNQYVRTRLLGALRPNAILVPQRAVQQSAKGHFVWVVNKDSQAELRPVQVGDWYGDSWFIAQGLSSGDRVIVDGTLRLAPGSPVKATEYVAPPSTAAPVSASASKGATKGTAAPPAGRATTATVSFATGSATLDGRALEIIQAAAINLKTTTQPIIITGYTDRTGNHAVNANLAKQRAIAVRDALLKAGVPAERLQLKEPLDITGSGTDTDARRVDITVTG